MEDCQFSGEMQIQNSQMVIRRCAFIDVEGGLNLSGGQAHIEDVVFLDTNEAISADGDAEVNGRRILHLPPDDA